MIKSFIEKFRHSIRAKLISLFLLVAGIFFITNITVNAYVNRSLHKVNTVYSSNLVLNELSEKLNEVQSNVHEYLVTKSQTALENYYKSEQDYSNLINNLNDKITNDELLMLERSIRYMSDTYLKLTDETIMEKRGRNISKYKTSFVETGQINQYINSYIRDLNNKQLKLNSSNYNLLIDSLRYTEAMSLTVMITIVLISLLPLLLILRNLISPLVQLARNADEVADGNFDTEFIMPKSKDEVGILAGTFNTMLQSIKNYIEQIKTDMVNEQNLKERQLMMENHLKDAQLKYLQAQINPHFLFNSLNAAAQLAILEDAGQTGLFVEKMADFFRYNVKKMEHDATLCEEIEAVDDYIYIMNVRLTGDIKYRKEIADGIGDIRVPSMILQPIVENAVKYGIQNIDRDGEILLKAEAYEEHLVIRVIDNGAGMSEDKIEEIMSDLTNKTDTDNNSTGIGLGNVMNRLRLYYGKENLLTIHSDGSDKGTEVRIIIPKYQDGGKE